MCKWERVEEDGRGETHRRGREGIGKEEREGEDRRRERIEGGREGGRERGREREREGGGKAEG